jgi:4-amino-4-deoxy-L-arabinose transferase-like glycosyltransferase
MLPTTDVSAPGPRQAPSDLPRSFLAWLPLLWSRALFPGRADDSAALRWPALLLLLVLPGVLLYPRLNFALLEPDEGRYAEIPREMLARGEAVVPYLQGEPYLDKPPLFYWLVMACYRLFGVDNWTARLGPALAVHVCVLLVYLLGRRSLGEPAAFRGALLLTLAPGFLGMGRLLLLDGVLSLWVTLGVLAAFEAVRGPRLRQGWWLLAAASCGLGVLTKGPIILLLVVPPLWLYRRLGGGAWRLSWRACLAFAAVVLALALPWYVLVCLRVPAFAGHFLWEHNVVRFVAPFDHIRPVWFYLPILLAGLLPGTLLVVPFLRFLLSGDEITARRRCPELGFMLLAGGWCVVFFSLSGCKLPTYILPALPPLALALGYFLAVTKWRRARVTALVAALSFLLTAAGHNLVLPLLARYRSPLLREEVLVSYCGDRQTPVICYPRHCDTVAFYLGRDDMRSFRSKEIDELRDALREHPRTVVLFTHRHSLRGLRQFLPPDLRLVNESRFALPRMPGLPEEMVRSLTSLSGETAMGLCDVAVVERCTP